MLNWKNTIMALSLASFTALPVAAQQSKDMPAKPDAQTKAAESKARADADQAINEATTALEETAKAIKALNDDKSEEAVAALEKAIGKLEVVVTQHPDLKLAPVDVSTAILDVAATPDEIRRARAQALQLLKDHKLQAARAIISGLASEIDISTTYIPLGTYPLALKSAAALLKDGQKDNALAVLENAFSTLVVVDTVAPLPLLNGQALIEEAKTLSEKADRSEKENRHLSELLDALDAQIARGEALEYGAVSAFDELKSEMKAIREKTGNGGSGSGIFDKLMGLFDKMRGAQPATRR